MRRRLIVANPFIDVPSGPQVSDKRIVFVPAETVETVIAACRDNHMRLVFAMPGRSGPWGHLLPAEPPPLHQPRHAGEADRGGGGL